MIAAMARLERPRLVLCAAAAACLLLASGLHPSAAAESDLDAFMRQVMARRDDNWKKLQQYILDEREQMDLRGPAHIPLWGEVREYAWYIRDGFFVRSPVRSNGVTIAEAERRKYEADYLRREKERDRRAQRGGAASADASVPPANATNIDSLIRQTRQPEFISSAYFLRFHFDEGRYALVGREKLDGRELLRIEYYPATMFTGRSRGRRGDRDDDTAMLTLMDKASRVTLWVEQSSRQIVRFTFENVTPNFIPSNFLARLSTAQASMTMAQPFPDVWLPSHLEWAVGLAFAVGDADLRYTIDYTNYRQADAKATLVPDDLP